MREINIASSFQECNEFSCYQKTFKQLLFTGDNTFFFCIFSSPLYIRILYLIFCNPSNELLFLLCCLSISRFPITESLFLSSINEILLLEENSPCGMKLYFWIFLTNCSYEKLRFVLTVPLIYLLRPKNLNYLLEGEYACLLIFILFNVSTEFPY